MTPRHIFREDGVSSGEHAVTGSGNVDEFVLVFERIRSERELLLHKTYCSKLENEIADGRVRRVGAARLLIYYFCLVPKGPGSNWRNRTESIPRDSILLR
jgi:hypothetical protein